MRLKPAGNMQGYEPLSSDWVSVETSMPDYNAGYRLLYVKDKICICRIAAHGSKEQNRMIKNLFLSAEM